MGSSPCGSHTSIHEDSGSIPSLAVSCGVGHSHGSDPTLLGLWYGPPAIAPIQPLARELPYAMGKKSSPKKKKKKFKAKKVRSVGFPTVAQSVKVWLVSGALLVPSLPWLSGLRILCCHSCSSKGQRCHSDSIPGLETSICISVTKKGRK